MSRLIFDVCYIAPSRLIPGIASTSKRHAGFVCAWPSQRSRSWVLRRQRDQEVRLPAPDSRGNGALQRDGTKASLNGKSRSGKQRARVVDGANTMLASRRIATTFAAGACGAYVVAAILLARALSRARYCVASPLRVATMGVNAGVICVEPYQRVTLVALAVLLPDFRHAVGAYTDAVRALRNYRAPLQRLRFPSSTRTVSGTRNRDRGSHATPRDELLTSKVLPTRSHSRLASKANSEKRPRPLPPSGDTPSAQPQPEAPSPFSDVQLPRWLRVGMVITRRELNRRRYEAETWMKHAFEPAREKATQLQQLTTRSDLTLRKDVSIAAGSVLLSLVGYIVALTAEVNLAALIVIMANLAPSVLLSKSTAPRHELLALVRDARVGAAIVAALASAVAVLRPRLASYAFLLCCVALVVTRDPATWMRNL